MSIVLDRRLIALLLALGCAYVVSPVLAGVLAVALVLLSLDTRNPGKRRGLPGL